MLTRLVALSPGDGRVSRAGADGCARRRCRCRPCPLASRSASPNRRPRPSSPNSPNSSAPTSRPSPPSSASRAGGIRGDNTFGAVVLMYIADFVPRVRAGLEALGVGSEYLDWVSGPIAWDHATEPSDLVFNEFLPAVARMRALDPVTSELVRLRGAAQHNCRLCKSLREGNALDAGGSETLYRDIERFETSTLLDERAQSSAAVRRCVNLDACAPRRRRCRRGALGVLRGRGRRTHPRRHAQRQQQDRRGAGRRRPARRRTAPSVT